MAFNIWERWPWTSFQNLNLDWLMKAVKEAVMKAEEASASVGQFDARITANTKAIEQLSDDMETISSPAHVLISSELEARYRGNLVTGSQLVAMVQTHGDLPYVEYNGEIYMLDSVSTAGDLRFSMAHTTALDDVIIRHILIPAASYNAAYSITNVSSGGSTSGNVFAVIITDRGAYADPEYIMDSTFDTIRSQMNAERTPVFLIKTTASGGGYNACGNVVSTTSYIDVYDPLTSTVIGKWRIYPDNTISRINAVVQLAALQNIIDMVNDGVSTNALLKTAQTLTAAEQAQVKQNLGISGTGGGTVPRVPITAASSAIPPLSPNTLYVFTGDATALNIQLAAPSDSNIANEYHFIFNSGATPTTLTLPSTINQPDGFTVEANHVYEVSILEGNMTAQGWAVSA